MTQTWTGLPEIKDPAPRPCTIVADQEAYLTERIGWANYVDLEFRLEDAMPLAPDEVSDWRKTMGTVRELYPSEWLPSHQLGVFFNPDAPRRTKDAAIETFQWPWPKLSQETLAKLDALQPDYEIQKEAAIRYTNAHEPTVIPIKASVGLPVGIIIFVVIALAIAAKAMV